MSENTTNSGQLVRIKTVQEYLGLSRGAVLKLPIKSIRIGRNFFYDMDKVNAWKAEAFK